MAEILGSEEVLARGVAWLAARDGRAGAGRRQRSAATPATQATGLCHALVGHRRAAGLDRLGRCDLGTAGGGRAGPSRPRSWSRGRRGCAPCGLSRPKIRYALALAAAGIDFDGLAALDDPALIDRLVALPGIGRWTAEIYGTTALGRADLIPAGDLALQEATRLLYGLSERPSEAALRARAAPWAPWRGVAARLLWSHYAREKKREGVT